MTARQIARILCATTLAVGLGFGVSSCSKESFADLSGGRTATYTDEFGTAYYPLRLEREAHLVGIGDGEQVVSLQYGTDRNQIYAVTRSEVGDKPVQGAKQLRNGAVHVYSVDITADGDTMQATKLYSGDVVYANPAAVDKQGVGDGMQASVYDLKRANRYYDGLGDVFIPSMRLVNDDEDSDTDNAVRLPDAEYREGAQLVNDGWLVADAARGMYINTPWLQYGHDVDITAGKLPDLKTNIVDAMVADTGEVDARSVILGGCAVRNEKGADDGLSRAQEAQRIVDKVIVEAEGEDAKQAYRDVMERRSGSDFVATVSGGPDLAVRDINTMIVAGANGVSFGTFDGSAARDLAGLRDEKGLSKFFGELRGPASPEAGRSDGSRLDPDSDASQRRDRGVAGDEHGASEATQEAASSDGAVSEQNENVYAAGLRSVSCAEIDNKGDMWPFFVSVDPELSTRYVEASTNDEQTGLKSKNFYSYSNVPDILGLNVSSAAPVVESGFVADPAAPGDVREHMVHGSTIRNIADGKYYTLIDRGGDISIAVWN